MVKFIEPLTDQCIEEGEEATFACVLNFDDVSVTWFKNGVKLHRARDILITSEGANHSLTLKNINSEDQGVISIAAENLQVVCLLLQEAQLFDSKKFKPSTPTRLF